MNQDIKKYSELNILQKINYKANRVAANIVFDIDASRWTPNMVMFSGCPIWPEKYTTPYFHTKVN